ncbi:adenosine deaminase/editase [Achaetomium macrosporum]|uniref:Adenosine deaminase/editase n=1 Tax=Achaetomium macrosporum TaxID=79813 RepID=A0AAN7C9E3_9PEZI|nr:adenosine deaminase/editase [Achaetomium macrosporum]
METEAEADAIASVVLEEFRKLPAKRKPAVRDNGLREWVPLSGIVVKGPGYLKCVALATGMKCLPASKLTQANGVALHDWHAEVLTLRAFNRFLLDECRHLAQDSTAQSDFLRRRMRAERSARSDSTSPLWHSQPFAWREDLTIHMYCSEAPCGDASMELVMSSQADATPWTMTTPVPPSVSPIPSPPPPPSTNTTSPTTNRSSPPPLLGRGYFSQLGIVRRKPARGDAPPSYSKSCSDKLALKQCTSLLCSLTSLFVSPRGVYLTSLVLPKSQYSPAACHRCFAADGGGGGGTGDLGDEEEEEARGRMEPLRGRVWNDTGYGFNPFRVETTEREFEFSRRGLGTVGNGEAEVKLVASNLAVAWTRDGKVEEGLIGGVLQGRKAFDLKGASLTSRRRMWAAAVEVAAALREDEIARDLGKVTYDGVKEGELLGARRQVKEDVRQEALKGWLRNTGDDKFSL